MEKTIIVHYLDFTGIEKGLLYNYLHEIVYNILPKDEGIISYVAPVYGQPRFECLGEKYHTIEEWEYIEYIFNRNQEIITNFIKDLNKNTE